MRDTLFVEIVSPDGTKFRGEAKRFRAPGIRGSFEILLNHAPMLAATGIGPIYVTTPSGDRIMFATSGGFVQVLNNRVIMLAETAEPSAEIDIERARASEESAKKALEGARGAERTAAERELERARNRLRIAMGSVGTK
jgi:F-type H+-transporting ATPase subunit epsilon